MARNVLLFAHVVFAIVLIGPATMASSSFARHLRAGDDAAMSTVHRTTRAYGTAAVVVPVVGLVLAARQEQLAAGWVQAAVVLVVAAALLLFGFHLPAQRRALRGERDQLARLRASAGGFSLVWVVIVWLMVAKPS